jgi:hypothetical protein
MGARLLEAAGSTEGFKRMVLILNGSTIYSHGEKDRDARDISGM